MAEQGPVPSFPGLPPLRSLELAGAKPPATLEARVPRQVVDTTVLAAVLRQRGRGEAAWAGLRAEQWEKALRHAGLLAAVESPGLDNGLGLAPQLLREIGDRLRTLRALERRLGEAAGPDEQVPAQDLHRQALVLGVFGVCAAVSPSPMPELLAFGLGAYALRAAYKLWMPRLTVDHGTLAEARNALARAVLRLIEHTFVVAVGDQVLECTPHAVYLQNRLQDLDAAHGGLRDQIAERQALIAQIRQANAALGRPQDDAETTQIQRSLDDLRGRQGQIDRLRDDCAAQLEQHQAQIARHRAVATRQALSSGASALSEGADPQVLAELEVDIAEIAARIQTLDLGLASADAELRAVLEVAGHKIRVSP